MTQGQGSGVHLRWKTDSGPITSVRSIRSPGALSGSGLEEEDYLEK